MKADLLNQGAARPRDEKEGPTQEREIVSRWPMVPLGEVAAPVSRPIDVAAGKLYRTIGVKWWGEGAYERKTIDGAETAAKTLSLVRKDDLIINKIWVRHGSTAIATEAVDGCAASNEFPTFQLDLSRVEPRWLHWVTKTRWFWSRCDALSMGTSGKNRIRPERFLEILVPLPPLAEQQRFVERLDMLAQKIKAAQRLRLEADAERKALFDHAMTAILRTDAWPMLRLAELLREDSRNGLGARPSDEPPGVPILRISAGTSRADAIIDEDDFKYLQISQSELERYRLECGDLLACRFNGNLRYVGRFSLYLHERGEDRVYPDKLIRFRVDRTRVLPEFVCLAMNAPTGRRAIEAFCATTAGNIGISATQLKSVLLPVPAIADQERMVGHFAALRTVLAAAGRESTQTKMALDAIFPSVLNDVFGSEH